jgi:gliding motility-associated-like protein
MKKQLLLKLSLLLLCSYSAQAQFQNGLWTGKQAYNWYFGYHSGLNFNTTPPTVLTDGQTEGAIDTAGNQRSLFSTGTVSDAQGNLLFYTDGHTIFNKNHDIMLNGTGLGDEWAYELVTGQNGLIVPVPGNPNRYYVFTQSYYGEQGLWYSEVDMSLDEGLGAVTENKNIVLTTYNNKRLTAVYHEDERQVWVLTHLGRFDDPATRILAFLVSDTGVKSTPVTSNFDTVEISSGEGQLKASPDGSKLAVVGDYGWFLGFPTPVHVYDFNNATGEVSNQVDLSSAVQTLSWGVEFSPNSRFLYVEDNGFFMAPNDIKQFDLEAGDQAAILASGISLLPDNNNDTSAFMQVGPDGKIYIVGSLITSSPEEEPLRYVNVINFPNNKGMAAGLDEGPTTLNKLYNAFPTFIQTYFESGILYEGGQCARDEVTFSTIRIPGIERIVWNFGDTASGAANTATDLEPTHAFTAAGTYTVTATITSNGAEQTATTTIVITAPDAVVPVVPAVCADSNGNAVFNLTQLNAGILNGQDAAVFSLAYFATEADVASNTPIATPNAFTTSGQAVFARVTNTLTGCTTTISFNLVVNPLPTATVPNAMEICTNTSLSAVFNLTSQDAAIRNAQDADTFTVSYYTSTADVQANNAIANPVAFTSTGQTVYAMVTNSATGCTSAILEFDLVVKQPVIVPDAIATEGCAPFNLTALAPAQSAGLTLSYYTAEQDAITATNAIAQFEVYRFEGEQQTLYIRAEDPQGCASIYTLQLQVGNCEIPRGISPNNDGKNDSFDLSGFDVKQLSIYNRYGQQVYSRNNYQSEWHGQNDNNNDLPTGTYYYSIEQDGGEQKTGWVYINREVN